MIKEFKEFISKGPVLDLAVAVIIGAAFGKIITALVDSVLMPLVGIVLGGVDFSSLSIKVGESVILYGAFIQAVVDFLIVSLCLFLIVKAFNKVKKPKKEKPEVPADIKLLEEIRDLLKKNK